MLAEINYTLIMNQASIFDIKSLVIKKNYKPSEPNLIFYAIREMKTNWIFCTKSSKVYDTYALVMRNVSSVETG